MKRVRSKLGLALLKGCKPTGLGREDEPEEDDQTDESKETKKRKTRSKTKAISSKGSEREEMDTDYTESPTEDEEEDPITAANLMYAKPDKKFGEKAFTDTDKRQTWNVLVRIIEGRDLQSGATRVRVFLESLQKCTRVCAQDQIWNQNLVFQLKDMTLQNLASQTLSIKATRVKRFSEKVRGEFCCPMAAVVHSSGRMVISKWVALTAPFDEEDDDAAQENLGFLKVSISVFSSMESPPRMNDDIDSEEVWSGAQLEEISLRVRLFRLHQLADEIHQMIGTNRGKPLKFSIGVCVGSELAETSAEEKSMYNIGEIITDIVSFNQDLIIPMLWPTVISKISFRLFMVKGRKRRCLGQASIAMNSIYEPGKKGFMPTFGPTFLNFFGYEKIKGLKWRKQTEKNMIREGEGSKYLARLLVSVDCVEYAGESVQRTFIEHSTLVYSKIFEKMHRYGVYCTFFACNLINPLFASDKLTFLVSMGEYGSTGPLLSRNRNSVLGALPDHDDRKYFSMPWGNHKPIADVPGLWENVDARIERSNAIMKVGIMLDSLLREARRVGEGKSDEVSSLAVEALEHMQIMMGRLTRHHEKQSYLGQLFRSRAAHHQWPEIAGALSHHNLQIVIKFREHKILKEIDGFKFDETQCFDDMGEMVVRFLQRMRENVLRLARDDQISLPYVIIKMLAADKVVGYLKVPVQEIYFSENEALSGQWCGRMRAMSMMWPTAADRRHRLEDFPAVVHVKMWFGRRGYDWAWKESLQPAEIKSYFEVFAYQRRNKLSSAWKDAIRYSDERNIDDLSEFTTKNPYGWKYMGNWVVRNTQDMWVCSSDGRPTLEDKVFEVHEWRDGKWQPLKFTDYFGGEIDKSRLRDPGKGWKYEGKWVPDKHSNYGDKSGWVYSITDVFWGEPGTVENERRADHKFRRRCIKRTRKAIAFHNQNLETYQASLGDTKWEYATNEKEAYHYQEVSTDCVRRRRFVMEIERMTDLPREREHEMYFIPRMYSVHEVTTTWQLRAYFLWAKDLLPVVKNSARAFVRVTFLTKAKQTLVVEDSQNPVWNETLIFDKMLIPGGKRQISLNPPAVMVEVRGELSNGGEAFLGRFQVNPLVICAPTDQRASPSWNTLTFELGRSRGSVLACFELFCQDKSTKDTLPLLPMRKRIDSRFEVPGELRPKMNNFAIQILCWGVRNLRKYQFLSVRRPFLELIIGDMETRTDPIANVSKDPNFETPLITFPLISLPSDLHFSPPLVINLYDTRAFKREPLVGVCQITNFGRYTRVSTRKKETTEKPDWTAFDKLIEKEEELLATTPLIPSLRREGMPELDWWSKYYASQGLVEKAPGFVESGIEYLTIFNEPLEDVGSYNGFTDFLETFTFVKSSRGNYDDPEEKEKSGELKGKVFITRIPEKESDTVLLDPPGVEFLGTVKCLLRVYIVEARGLASMRKNGMCDPYLIVKIGKHKVNLKKKYRADTVNPVFGECIELEVNIPVEKDLKVTVMDQRKIVSDDTIGSTKIDLENRLLTKYRATVGLSRQHTIQGEMQWRDQLTPLATLKGYCRKMQVDPPKMVEKDGDVGIKILGIEFWHSQVRQEMEEWDKAMASRAAGGKDSPEGAVDGEIVNSEPKSGQDEKSQKWQRGDEVRAKKASIAQHGTLKRDVELNLEEQLEVRKLNREKITGRPLQQVALFILLKMNLVPEHVETRTLLTEMGGNAPCGELRMFVDIFPMDYGLVPPPIVISPRDPENYQLRIALFNVCGAIPVKRSFGVPTSDLYVKVYINGSQKAQKSDVHFRSTDGCGEFNWRFVINVAYNPWERKIINYSKKRLFKKASESMMDPLVIIQLWDKNKFRKDEMLGQMVMDITHFKEGIDNPEDVGIIRKRKASERCRLCSRKCCCVRVCIFCKDTRCGCKARRTVKMPFPKPMKYKIPKEDVVDTVNLFDSDSIRGWWPVLTEKPPHREDKDAAKKKDDDIEEEQMYIMGLLELEMALVTETEAKADPVGKKRKEPNHSPYLPKPLRSSWNMFFITSRIRPCCCWVWHKCGIQVFCWIVAILLLVVAGYGLFVNWPVVTTMLIK